MGTRLIVVDTSVWIAYLRKFHSPAVSKLNAIASSGDILVGDIVLMEVLQGARDAAHAAGLERTLRNFKIVDMMDNDLAVQAARHYRALRGSGITIRKSADLIIATFCIVEGHQLLHDDRDFEPFVKHLGLRCL